MKAKTIAHCFGFLAILLSVCLVGEFLFAVFTGRTPQSIHKSFPLVTFPALIKMIQNPGAGSETPVQAVTRLRITLKNGRVITGEKISEDASEVTLKVDGSSVGFVRTEIAKVEEVSESADA